MNEETRRAIVAEIATALQPRVKQPWEFDTEDVLRQCPGMTRASVYEQLKRRVVLGELKSAMVYHDGRQRRVFWRPGDVVKE